MVPLFSKIQFSAAGDGLLHIGRLIKILVFLLFIYGEQQP